MVWRRRDPGEMDRLKEKIFQFGIYGARLTALTKDEVEAVVEQPWAEIVTADDIARLRESFTTDCLRTMPNRQMVDCTGWEGLYVRMGSLAWKDHLTSGTFNFTSGEYFLIMSLLIETRRYVDNVELRKLGLDPKKTHYCINRLARKGFIEYRASSGAEKKKFIYKVRVAVDERGFVVRSVPEQPAPAASNAAQAARAFEYRLDVGLYDNVREMILGSAGGVITEDLKNKLGVSSKVGYKLLNKVLGEEQGVFLRSEEFEGRMRRYRYHAAGQRGREGQEHGDAKAVGYITPEERVRAIRKLMAMSPVLQLDKRTYEKLQELTGWRYEFDRRTIVRAAVLAGFKIYKQRRGKDGKCSRYMIVRSEVVESDIKALDVSSLQCQEEMSEFQKKVYGIFVNSPRLVEMDNGYVPVRGERARLLHGFLDEYMSCRGVDAVRFDWEVIRQMSFGLLLAVVPFGRVGFRDALCRFVCSGGADEGVFEAGCLQPGSAAGDAEALDGKTVSDVVGMRLPASIRKLIRLKIGVAGFVPVLKHAGDLGGLAVEASSSEVVIKRTTTSSGPPATEQARRPRSGAKYVCLQKRLWFFERMREVAEAEFYDEAYKLIYSEFEGDEFEAMLNRLKMFKDDGGDMRQGSFERLYMGFKRNVIELGWVGALDLKAYSVTEAKRALKALSRDKVIANYKGIRRIEFVTPHEAFARAVGKKYDVFRFQGYHEQKGMGYFSHYFDMVYYVLATSGSLEVGELVQRIRFIAPFEMELFLCEYKEVFRVSIVDGTRIVSLGIFMDPFE